MRDLKVELTVKGAKFSKVDKKMVSRAVELCLKGKK